MARVDMVILSKATDYTFKAMTQNAVNSAIRGYEDVLNVVVVEQMPDVTYDNATTIHNTETFNYNRSCNLAAKMGEAEWIVFANNDLKFEPGWLDYLLAADYPVVSPIDPDRQSQKRIRKPEKGYVNAVHFSGWCFMMKRDLWEKIGMLDEDFVFWCADDSVIEQLRIIGVQPMVVPLARVRHLVSKTMGRHGSGQDDGSMTWAMVRKFEKKYGPHRMRTDPRYHTWQRRNVM